MKYDLSLKTDLEKCKTRLNQLAKNGAFVEVTDKSKRSIKQNSYLHVLLTALALELGYNLATIKTQIYKGIANKDLFLREKNGKLGAKKYWRSSSKLSTTELSQSIEALKKWAAEHGIYLPDANEEQELRAIEKEYSKYKHLVE